jgi:anti-anti-sigma factor
MFGKKHEHYRWYLIEGIAVLEVITREIANPELALELSAQLRGAWEGKVSNRFLINLKNVRYMSSSGFAALLSFAKAAIDSGAAVIVCDMHPDIRLGADIIRLGQVIPIEADEESGLAALAKMDVKD